MYGFLFYITVFFLTLSLCSCFEILNSYLQSLKNSRNMLVKPSNKSIVGHLYIYLGIGRGKTTIGIFEDAEKGLEFIKSFEFNQKIYCANTSTEDIEAEVEFSYSIEFTAKEALEKGFLDMSQFYHGREIPADDSFVHILFLDEVKLNKQLLYTIEDD